MRIIYTTILVLMFAAFSAAAQTNNDTAMILPFENTSDKAEFNWVGESFADALADLLKVPTLNVVSNDERKTIQQKLRVPLTVLPSLATSLKLAREGKATILIGGKYNIVPAQGDTAASVSVTAKIIRVNEGRFLSEEFPDGRRVTRDIILNDALQNLQTVQGQVAYQILYQRDKALPFSQNQFVESANKVPARAFEAYIKGLLTSETDSQRRENYFKNAMRLYGEAKGGETYANAALELGHLFLNQRKFSEAIDNFSRIQPASSQFAEAAFYIGLIQWQQKNYEQALAVLRPLAEELKLTSVYNTLGAIAVQASIAERKNKGKSDALLKEGLELLKKASESAPDETASRFNYAFALFLNNDYKAAAAQLRPILAASPRDGEAYFLLAKALEKTGEQATAADFDNQARRFLVENNRYAKLESGWKNGSVDDVNLRVQQPPRKDFVSVVLIKKQATPTAAPLNETETLLAQARTLYKNGGDDDAMAVLRRVLASEPMSAEAYLLLGNIHLRRGDLEQAVSSLKTALFWDNKLVMAHVGLGKIYLQRGDCLQAKNYTSSALAVEAENQDALGLQRQVERCSK
ncbi:MAG: hypothetical protein AVDCRST_MAG74-2157 [uncultured Pyrinomonadaceae bacterium]|uniref:Tetratricopeptide repeat protein n=1 Tax=uncultured Pyrinomonadaceae bacterium TaxID=2283094 RepID=A0A6J4PGP2_9BACT|nr:MAG: hypothetical protein AVDCRST_MAG74-2157 [uncultured Pyrinomonadaceae bacterium]